METLMKMKWKIGSVEIENPFILAPMAGVTDLPFRILCKEQGAGLLCTEMVSAKAISFNCSVFSTEIFLFDNFKLMFSLDKSAIGICSLSETYCNNARITSS